MSAEHYVIRGGIEGRERLRILARAMRPSSMSLFDRLGVGPGLVCLDVGCGGGDVSMELARRVAPSGRVVGTDIDAVKLDIAASEAAQEGIANVEFRTSDVRNTSATGEFDFVYARFLLTHLSDPADVVNALNTQVRPGGLIALEDIDFSGYFTYPESAAFQRYHELYCATVRKRGGDPNIGPRLPSLLKNAGLVDVGMSVAQPIAMQGDIKLLNPITMENIAAAVLADGLATAAEIESVVRELYEFAADENTLAGLPRIVQAWGRRRA